MIIDSHGRVTQVNTPLSGWYKVALNHSPEIEVQGVSLKNTVFSIGQTVTVFQYGLWGNRLNEFGFTELAGNTTLESLKGQLQINPQMFGTLANDFPYQVASSYLALSANNKRLRYFPAVVTAVGATTLTCKDYENNSLGMLQLASDLTASDFQVNDKVLVQTNFENHRTLVLGWWLTVPDSKLRYYTIYSDDNTGIRYLKNLFSGVEYQINTGLLSPFGYFHVENGIPYGISVDYVGLSVHKIKFSKINLLTATVETSIEYENLSGDYIAIPPLRPLVENDYVNGFWTQISGGTMPDEDRYFMLRILSNFSSIEKKNIAPVWDSDGYFRGVFSNKNTLFEDSLGNIYTLDQNYNLVTTHSLPGYSAVGCGANNSAWGYSKTGATLKVYNSVEAVEYTYNLSTDLTDLKPSQSNENDNHLIFFEMRGLATNELSFVVFNKISKVFSRVLVATSKPLYESATNSYFTAKSLTGDY